MRLDSPLSFDILKPIAQSAILYFETIYSLGSTSRKKWQKMRSIHLLFTALFLGAQVSCTLPEPTEKEVDIPPDGGATNLPLFDAGQPQNQNPDAGSSQSVPQDAGQGLLQDGGQTQLQDAGAGHSSPATFLEAHYPFEGHALDATGNHDGTVIGGALFSPDAWAGENSLALMGVDSAIDLGPWNIQGQGLTLAAWLKPTDFSDSDARIISKAAGMTETEHVFMLSERANQLRLRIRANGRTDTLIAGDLPTGSWIHVAGTYDTASGLMTLYIDGEEKGQRVHLEGGALDQDPTVPIWIGANPDGSNYYNGLMDEVRMYSKALTESEIKGLVEPPPASL